VDSTSSLSTATGLDVFLRVLLTVGTPRGQMDSEATD
jgi:hypothetical protein